MTLPPIALPIDALLPEVTRALRGHASLVIEAEPGAGKTTRVPPVLLDLAGGRDVLVLEPRRLAARLAATFVARERGEEPGGTVGYQVRFEEAIGPKTRVRFVTEGLLLRYLLEDPRLSRVGVVVFDEFHERHLATDVGLTLVRRLQHERAELKLVIMSATLESQALADFLGGAPILDAPGRRYEVDIEHLGSIDDRPLEVQVASAVRRLLREGERGDILVFLPGMAEIRRAEEACAEVARAHDLMVVLLHGDLPAADQDKAVRKQPRQKVILSTNVAESSVTIDGVTAVVDSGLSRQAGHDPWSGLPTLRVRPISQASATQRAGRAGRTAPGRALRLFSRADFDSRPQFDKPEIERLDLAEVVLLLATLDIREPHALEWLDPPPPEHLAAARQLLTLLGAIDGAGAVTPLGRELARLPLHPRQARIAVEAARRGAARGGALIASLLGERDLRSLRGPARESGSSDLLALSDVFREAKRRRFDARELRSLGINAGAARNVDRATDQIARQLRGGRLEEPEEVVLEKAILAGYPDRVARRVPGTSLDRPELLLSGGGRARLSDQSVVREAELVVAVDAEEPQPGRGQRLPLVRLASRIDEEWQLELCPQGLRDESSHEWSERLERVEAVSRLSYGEVVLHETRKRAEPSPEAARVIGEAVARVGLGAFVDPERLAQLSVRLGVLRGAGFDVPALGDDTLRALLGEAAQGAVSFAELRERDLLSSLVATLPASVATALPRLAPESIALPSGRRLTVHYEPSAPPWVESYLQDFFGMRDTPRIADGRVPLTLHLLAPSRRPVQVTTDLSSFWRTHYPELKRQLSRRYPRHAWPDDPTTAAPPKPKPKPR